MEKNMSRTMLVLVPILLSLRISAAHTKPADPSTSLRAQGASGGVSETVPVLLVTVQGDGRSGVSASQTASDGLLNSGTPAPSDVSQSSPTTTGGDGVVLRTQEAEYETESPVASTGKERLQNITTARADSRVTHADPEEFTDPDGSGGFSDDEVEEELENGPGTEPSRGTSQDEETQLGNGNFRHHLILVGAMSFLCGAALLLAVVFLMKRFTAPKQNGDYSLATVCPE
ncbi:uncharacterized protein LOC121274057 isoform X2 [Carcharodon carcharias]|uniref:uncharacterized protein LOC121274057 isoform X2 n=1 Tax=Carcharodon carcharias TaxID=13397 RepID=UPI001B7ED9E6|nr:uncharacterized protein LOC121274057 isoform X2 [Carcharodon carcharias]